MNLIENKFAWIFQQLNYRFLFICALEHIKSPPIDARATSMLSLNLFVHEVFICIKGSNRDCTPTTIPKRPSVFPILNCFFFTKVLKVSYLLKVCAPRNVSMSVCLRANIKCTLHGALPIYFFARQSICKSEKAINNFCFI